MKKMIYIDYENENDKKTYLDSRLFYNEFTYKLFISKNNIHVLDTLVLELSGNDYKSRKRSLQDLAGNFYIMTIDASISWLELSIIQNWFYGKAKKYGLVSEFKENGII